MQDVVIRRCTVRVVRRSGWSWGADPRRLLRRVTDAVPGLVAARIDALLSRSAVSGTIDQPVRLRVPVKLSEIATLAFGASIDAGTLPVWRARLEAAIDDAVRTVVAPAGLLTEPPREDVPAPSAVNTPSRSFVEELIDALSVWRASGVLPAVIARLDDPHVRAWIEALASFSDSADASVSEPANDTGARVPGAARVNRGLTRRVPGARLTTRPVMRDGTEDGLPVEVGDPNGEATGPASRSAGPGDAERPGVDQVAHFTGEPAASEASPKVTRPPRATTTAPPTERAIPATDVDMDVPSALPWLILGPLHKLGFLRTLGAALEAAALTAEAPLFAAALAFKLTPSAERPWSKTASADRLAMAMAARLGPVSKADVHRFAQRVDRFCPVIDGAIASAVVGGRRAGDPWIVQRAPVVGDAVDTMPRFCLIDPPGLFPVAWGVLAAEVVTLVGERPGAGCIVPEDSADAGLLAALDQAGIRFFTTARPGRGESWATVEGVGAPPWRTNQRALVDADTRAWLRRHDDIAGRALALSNEFGIRRVALALDPTSGLERSLALATTVGLATLAWTLWHEREDTDALLMLQRFEDLDARVRFTRRAVRVVVPLGRRHRDLLDAGLLRDVSGVPWLGGRVLEFSGG